MKLGMDIDNTNNNNIQKNNNYKQEVQSNIEDVEIRQNEDNDAFSKRNKNIYTIICIVGIMILIIVIIITINIKKDSMTKVNQNITSEDNAQNINQDDFIVDDDKQIYKDTTEVVDLSDMSPAELEIYASEHENQILQEQSTSYITDKEQSLGIPDFNNTSVNTITDDYSEESFTQDLYGDKIKKNYTVKNIRTVKAFVNYEKKRGHIDNGMDIFWLDIIYNEKKYKKQVSYSIYRSMAKKGICAVTLEVLTLENDGTVISYMDIITDYSELTNENY